MGLFGYFPTYSLGNVYAGCLNQTLRLDVPDLDEHLRAGQTVPATRWLKENLQQYGLLKTPSETITDACRFEPSEAPLLNYLNTKFTKIYNL